MKNIIIYYIKKMRETNWYLELYEDYPTERKEQLNKREGEIIREIGTLNQRIETRTDKEYREDNKDKIKEKDEEYSETNKDKIKDKIKENIRMYVCMYEYIICTYMHTYV
jgi:hypothetical protein